MHSKSAGRSLTPEQVEPDIRAASERSEASIDAIATRRPGFPQLCRSTFLALEDATDELDRAWSKVSHLQSVADSPPSRAAHNAMLPRVSAFYARSAQSRILAAGEAMRGDAAPEAAALTGIRRRFSMRRWRIFGRPEPTSPRRPGSGWRPSRASWPNATQKYLRERAGCDERLAIIDPGPGRLQRPAGTRRRRRPPERRGQRLGNGGKSGLAFCAPRPSQEPFMTYLEDADLRAKCGPPSTAVGAAAPHDNTALIGRILALRSEKAALLGKSDFADVVLERRMAKSGARVGDFLDDLRRRSARLPRRMPGAGGIRLRLPAPPRPGRGLRAENCGAPAMISTRNCSALYFPIAGVVRECSSWPGVFSGLPITPAPPKSGTRRSTFYDVYDARGRHIGSFYATGIRGNRNAAAPG